MTLVIAASGAPRSRAFRVHGPHANVGALECWFGGEYQVEARNYFVERHIPRFARFERWAGRRVLEIGCGIGTDAVNFARAPEPATREWSFRQQALLWRKNGSKCFPGLPPN